MPALMKTDLPGIKLYGRGKVRDIYDAGEHLLIIATDRLSAFDVVLPTPIPNKGKVLTQMSSFWFDHFKDFVPNHVVATEVPEYPKQLHAFRDQLEGRSMLVKKAKVFPIECVARGFLTGSGLKDYNKTGQVCGIPLPAGLRDSDRLPKPIFTPATKAETGHDENVSEEQAAKVIGEQNIQKLKDLTLSVYGRAVEYARKRGIILKAARQRYLPFFDYPLVEHVQTLVEYAQGLYPTIPLRQGLRKIGRLAYTSFLDSLVGKVLWAGVDNVSKGLETAAKAYAITSPVARATLVENSAGRARVRLEGIYYFLDCNHVGVFEGVLRACKASGTVLVRIDSPTSGELLITWC